MKPESATDRLIMAMVEDRLAKLDAMIDSLRPLTEQDWTDAIAHRLFLLEHRIGLLEEALEGRARGPREVQ